MTSNHTKEKEKYKKNNNKSWKVKKHKRFVCLYIPTFFYSFFFSFFYFFFSFFFIKIFNVFGLFSCASEKDFKILIEDFNSPAFITDGRIPNSRKKIFFCCLQHKFVLKDRAVKV